MGGPLVDGVVCEVGKHVRVRRRAPVRWVGVARRREAAEALLEDIPELIVNSERITR